MFCSFLLCSCTCSLFISMTNSRDSCSDSQNAPGLPWACRQGGGQTLKQPWAGPVRQGGGRCYLEVPLQVPAEGGLPDPRLQLLVVPQLRPQPPRFSLRPEHKQLKRPRKLRQEPPRRALLPSGRPGRPGTSPSAGLPPPRGPSSAPPPSSRIPPPPRCCCAGAER